MGEVAKIETQEVETADPVANALAMIARAASDPGVDVEKMERLMAMHDSIVARRAEVEFNEAMSTVQAEMHRIAADADNKQTHSSYASYAALDRELRPIYTRHGFALSFDSEPAGESMVRVLCRVSHRAGHTHVYKADMPADGKGAKGGDVMTKTHATGSAFTYGQRYLLKMIFNVAVGADDDGNGAGSDPITAEQKEQIIALIKETGADTKAFLKFMGAEAVDHIPAAKFDQAIAGLNKKKAKADA